jgi:Amt family ammonium transporter
MWVFSLTPLFLHTIPFALFAVFSSSLPLLLLPSSTGGVAEKNPYSRRYWSLSSYFSLFIYAPLGNWTWHHPRVFFASGVYLDFAGGTVVHISAGFAGPLRCLFLKKRQGRRGNDNPTIDIPYILLETVCYGSVGSRV